MEPRNLIVGTLLLLLAGGSWWLSQSSSSDREETKTAHHTPDYYIEGFTGINMDSEGKPSQRLTAERMTHYPDDNSTELILPKMTVYDGDRPPWRIRSERGWISGDGEVILLKGEVHIDRSVAAGVRPIHITTRDLRAQPKDNYVESDADTHIISQSDTLDSRGIQVWFSQPVRIKLLANVRGRYEVNP
ncbi:MAG: LPS export ABC transporter periplasmic protein LptC [Sedimenticola sp.]